MLFQTQWDEHRDEERWAARCAHADLGLRGAHRSGPAHFLFPDQTPFLVRRADGSVELLYGWCAIANRAGAPDEQIRKALRMANVGLHAKARRQAYCGVIGARFDCASFEPGRSSGHRFFRRYSCWNRYCSRCGPVSFRRLFAKYVKLRDVAVALLSRRQSSGRRIVTAKIDFTTKNLGRMPTAREVRVFNRAIRRFFRLVERRFNVDRRSYGVVFTDEFGYRNSNLHAHAMYTGPYLPNRGVYKNALSRLWRQVCEGTVFAGSFIVSIKPAEGFEAGLAHALKYAGKTLDLDPGRLADLELAFDRVRRVHTLAAFYNAVPKDASPADAAESGCPTCGAALVRIGSLALISVLAAQGCADLDLARKNAGRSRVFARAGP